MKKLFLFWALMVFVFSVSAQNNDTKSVGIIAGSMNGFSVKTQKNHFAFQFDLGYHITAIKGTRLCDIDGEVLEMKYSDGHAPLETFEADFNFMFEGNLVAGLNILAGGGFNMGMSWNHPYNNALVDLYDTDYYWTYDIMYCTHTEPMFHSILGNTGLNLIFGFEYKFDVSLALQLDTRIGSGLLFGHDEDAIMHYLDWGLNLGVRYKFN